GQGGPLGAALEAGAGVGFLARGVEGPAVVPGGPSGKRTSESAGTIAMSPDEPQKAQDVSVLAGALVLPSLDLPADEQRTEVHLLGSLLVGHGSRAGVLPQGGWAAAAVAAVLDDDWAPAAPGNAALVDEALAGLLIAPQGHLGDWSGPGTDAPSGEPTQP